MSSEAVADTGSRLRTTLLVGVAAFVLLAVAGLLVGVLRPATYRSTVILAVDDPSVLTASDTSGIAKASRLRELYGPLLTAESVVRPLSEEVGLTPAQVTDRLNAVVAKDSLLLLVSATGPSRADARRLAEAAGSELVRYTEDVQRTAGVPAGSTVRLELASPASPGLKVTQRTRTVLSVAGLLGLLGAVGAVVVVGRQDRPLT